MPKSQADKVSTNQALDTAARMIVQLVHGLVKTPEGRQDVMLDLISQLSQSRERNAAELAILSRVVEWLRTSSEAPHL